MGFFFPKPPIRDYVLEARGFFGRTWVIFMDSLDRRLQQIFPSKSDTALWVYDHIQGQPVGWTPGGTGEPDKELLGYLRLADDNTWFLNNWFLQDEYHLIDWFTAGPSEIASGVISAPHFDPDAIEAMDLFFEIPATYAAGEDITPHIHWTGTSLNTGNVVWKVTYRISNAAGQQIGAEVTDTVTDAVGSTGTRNNVAQFTAIDGSSIEEDGFIMARVERDATNVADTYADDACLLFFSLAIPVEKMGTGENFKT